MSLISQQELGPMDGNWTHPSYSLAPHQDSGMLGINTSLANDTGDAAEIGSGFYLYQKILIGITLSAMTFIAIVGNILVVAAVFTDRRLKRYSNFFIVSLAIADLLVAVGVMTFAIANDVQGVWYFGPVFCKIWISSDVMCCTASILNLCVISLDRYIHIKDPLHYDAWMTARKTYLFIAAVWVLSLVISFLPIQMGWHQRNGTEVVENSCAFDLNSVYAVVSSSISFYIPCIVMLSIYMRLYMYAKKHVESIKRTHTADRFHQNHGSTKSSYKVSDHKAAVTLGVIMGVFLLCWVPFFIINPIAAFCDNCIPKVAFQILTWLGYANSALNPIIYSIFNQEFRDAFRRILCPRWCNERRQMNMFATTIKKKKVIKSEYTPPLVENGSSSASTIRKNSRERLFTEKVTSL